MIPARRRRFVRCAALVLLAGAALASAGVALTAPARRPAPLAMPADTLAPTAGAVTATRIGEESYLGANDLARLLDAVKFWRADVRKLVLRVGLHRVTFTVDNPFVIVDQHTVRLPAEVRSRGGELQIPVAIAEALPSDSTLARLFFDPRTGQVRVLPTAGLVRGPSFAAGDSATRLVFPADRPEETVIASRARAHFRIRFEGFFAGTLPDTLPPSGLVESIHPIPSVMGSALELTVSDRAVGYRLVRDVAAHRVVLELWRHPRGDLEAFAPEVRPAPGGVRVVVLDPGHGGGDPGVRAGGLVEKDLALALARLTRDALERRGITHVLLTRDDDRAVPEEQRAEIANHARADIVLSLHFDGVASGAARGISVFCPPAAVGAHLPSRPDRLAPVTVVAWRDVAEEHAVQSRSLAEALLSTLDLRGFGPVRLREVLPATLIGVNAAGLMIECGMLTSPADRHRLAEPEGLRQIAAALADGVVAWERSE
jgi:N-acetylmuramoyl-L-alanine amidase